MFFSHLKGVFASQAPNNLQYCLEVSQEPLGHWTLLFPQSGGIGQSSNWARQEPSEHKYGLLGSQVIIVLHSSKFLAQVPSGQLTLLVPHEWYSGHSSIVALQELSKHFTGNEFGHTDIVEHDALFFLQVPSGHLYVKVPEHWDNESTERQLVIESTQAPFQHFILSLPQ